MKRVGLAAGGVLFTTLAIWLPSDMQRPAAIRAPSSSSARTSLIGVGYAHVCAITNAGGVKCWGRNNYGQLGTGKKGTSVPSPIQPFGLESDVTEIGAGENHTCALVRGGIKCWGRNNYGQLGMGSTVNLIIPQFIPSLSEGVTSIAVGRHHSCALLTTGEVRCWGLAKAYQLGYRMGGNECGQPCHTGPVNAQLPEKATALMAGGETTCARLVSGRLYCWGDNRWGQAGIGYRSAGETPKQARAVSGDVSSLGLGEAQSCGIWNSSVYCWGSNELGQLGVAPDNETLENFTVPRSIPLNGSPLGVAVGAQHVCAWLAEGGAMCWGDNHASTLGNGRNPDIGREKFQPVPSPVKKLRSTLQFMAANYLNTCAITDGRIWCWGDNTYGQLGTGARGGASPVPVEAPGF